MSISKQMKSTANGQKLMRTIEKATAKAPITARAPVLDQEQAQAIKQAMTSKDGSILSVLSSMLSKAPDGVIKLPQGIAKRILEEGNFPRQRAVKEARLNKHRSRLNNGTWRGEAFPITFAVIPPHGDQPAKLWLVNGQHRVTVISDHSVPVTIRVILHPVKDEDEAATLYTYFDDPSESRTDIEVLDAKGVTQKIGLPRQVVKALYGALSFLRNDMEPAYAKTSTGDNARDRDGRMIDTENWKVEASLYWEDIQHSDKWLKQQLLRPAITAVALLTYRYKTAKAREFWFGIASDDGLPKGDPRHTLIRDFRNRRSTKKNSDDKSSSKSHASSFNQRAVVHTAATAWNSFYENRELQIIKVINGAPLKIFGTPYQNGNRP